MERYSDGVWWIDLATLHAANLLAQAIAAALQVQERADESTLDTLVRFLANREVLLLLNNCEHLVAACAALVKRLLQTCPGLQILATSREALRGDGIDVAYIPDLITQLFNKSWLVAKLHEGEMRYRLLEPVRQYSAEKLQLSGAALTWQVRHAQWSLTLAEWMEPILKTDQQAVALKALALEHDNLRAALTRSLAHGNEPQVGVRLALALFRYWWMSNHVQEARHWFAEALNTPMPTARLRISVLNESGFLARWQGDYEEAYTVYQQSP